MNPHTHLRPSDAAFGAAGVAPGNVGTGQSLGMIVIDANRPAGIAAALAAAT